MENDEEGTLTSLPEEIRTKILSFLPTTDSVRASVWSKKWENIWRYVNNLHFSDTDHLNHWGRRVRFTFFVYYVLMNSECRILNSFHLSCTIIHERHVESWVNTAMKRQVKYLTINYDREDMVFPRGFLTCESFKKLELNGEMTLKVSTMIHYPNLTELYLNNVRIRNVAIHPTEELVLNLPALRVLKLLSCKWHHVNGIKICATEVVDFLVSWCSYDCECCLGRKDFTIEMVGCPYFITRGSMLENISISRPELVVGAEFAQQFRYDFEQALEWVKKSGERVATLLSTFSNLSTLRLSTDVIEATTRGVPPFLVDKVRELTVDHGCQMLYWRKALMQLLHSFPKLELLQFSIHRNEWLQNDSDGGLLEIPNCISKSLKVVRFEDFGASTSELRLARVFLVCGLVLKEMFIVTPSYNQARLEDELPPSLKASSETYITVEYCYCKKRKR